MSDADFARAQWLAQLKAVRRNERRMARALSAAYMAGLSRWQAAGVPDIPVDARRDLAAALNANWREAIEIGGRFPLDQDKGAFAHLEFKQGEIESLFQQLILEFIARFGAVRVQQITETTRDQLVRIIDRSVRDGLGQEEIARIITDQVPQFSRTRARVIARTETHTAAMFASQEVARQSPFPMNKRWVSVFDARTRDFGEGDGEVDQANHRRMNEVTVGMDELFQVPRLGGYDLMTGPGDPNAPPYQTINCRCALIYRRANRPWPKEGDN